MKITAYGYNLRSEDYTLIDKMVTTLIQDGQAEHHVQVLDLRSLSIDHSPDHIILVYGKQAARLLKGTTCKASLFLPDASNLDAAFGNADERAEAHQKLLEFRETVLLGNQNTAQPDLKNTHLDESTLPHLTSDEVLQLLEQTISKGNVQAWIGTTASGKKIKLTLEKEETNDADLCMTFAELFAIKVAMETLQVKEIEVVYRNNSRQ